MSNKLINIGGDANDSNYRYKMPPLSTKIEGRGNGIKTVLMNIPEVAKALHTEAPYATKFFGMEVGALSKYDNKRNVGIVHGVHNTKELQKMLNKFINEFILCPKCSLPELQFKVHQKKNVLLQKCASCGWKGSNSSNHKVKTYIINHPPKKQDKKDKDKDKKDRDKKDKRGSKTTSKQSKQPKQRKGDGKRKNNNKKTETNGDGTSGDNDFKELGGDNDEVWSVDISEDAVAQRKQKEMATLASKGKKNNKNMEEKSEKHKKNDNSPAQILRNYINSGDRSYLEILDEIKRVSLARKFDQKKKLQIAFEALCQLKDIDTFIVSLKKYKVIFAQFTKNSGDCKIFFGVLEEFVCRRNPDSFLPRVYKILEVLYDEDIVTEDDMILWSDSPTDQAIIVDKDEAELIRSKAEPFIKWLKESADSDSDSDEQEGGSDEDENDNEDGEN